MIDSSITLKVAFYNNMVLSGFELMEFIPGDFQHMRISYTSAGVFLYSNNLPFIKVHQREVPKFKKWCKRFIKPNLEDFEGCLEYFGVEEL